MTLLKCFCYLFIPDWGDDNTPGCCFFFNKSEFKGFISGLWQRKNMDRPKQPNPCRNGLPYCSVLSINKQFSFIAEDENAAPAKKKNPNKEQC